MHSRVPPFPPVMLHLQGIETGEAKTVDIIHGGLHTGIVLKVDNSRPVCIML